MKRSKELGKIFRLTVLLIVLTALFPVAHAYEYNDCKWTSGTADWRFSTDFPSGYKQCVRDAADTWSDAGSSFSFNYDSWEVTSKVDWTNLGSDGPTATSDIAPYGSSIQWVVTDINSALSWTTSPSSSYPPYDIQTTALHEFGHWLSLGDTYLDGTAMLWIYDGSVRSLSQDDINGINYIY